MNVVILQCICTCQETSGICPLNIRKSHPVFSFHYKQKQFIHTIGEVRTLLCPPSVAIFPVSRWFVYNIVYYVCEFIRPMSVALVATLV